MPARERLVIIGNGMAGARLAEEVRSRDAGKSFDIVMFGEERYGNYNRILLSGVLAGTHDPQDIFINPLDWYTENDVRVHLGERAVSIDRGLRTVTGENGTVERYDRLVFATGSSAFVPPVKGIFASDGALRDGVSVFRTLDDCDKITRDAEKSERAIVIGGGLLGLEAARGLLGKDVEVHVVHLMPTLMEAQLDSASARFLRNTLTKMGVQVHLEKATSEVLGDDRVTGVRFADGSELAADMIVVSAGIRANSGLARESGLETQRGIIVNDDLSTKTDPAVFAIGECAQHRGTVYGLVAPAWEQAKTLADKLTSPGSQAAYTGSRIATRLKVMGIDLTVMGVKEAVEDEDEEVVYSEPSTGVYKKMIVRNNRLVGAILLGDADSAPSLRQAFDREEVLPEKRSELLFPGAAGSAPQSAADMPESAQICNCNGVTKGEIAQVVKSGKRTLKAVCDATRAGTGCGTCKPQVQEILVAFSDGGVEEDPAERYYVPAVPMAKPELVAAVRERGLKSVSSVLAALAEGAEDAVSKIGLASLLKTVWAGEYDDERDSRFINDRVHANIQKDGAFSVVPRIYGGITTPAELKRIAEVAEKHNVPMVKLTGGQRLDLLGIPKEKLPEVWADLGMPSGHAYAKTFRTCKTCVGAEFCRFGLGDSTALGVKIEKRFQGIESPHKMKLAVSGCPRNCAESTTKDLGAVAIEGGKWEIYIGGAAGSTVRKGDLLCAVDSHEKVLQLMGRFMQYYRENGKYKERAYGFVARMGIERIQSVLIDDSEGICERLDKAIGEAVDAYVDPWIEGSAPTHPKQFESVVANV
jgi:nitrite reductase (NADH) large subunit